MDSKFKVPKIPLVTTATVSGNDFKANLKRYSKTGSSGKKKYAKSANSTAAGGKQNNSTTNSKPFPESPLGSKVGKSLPRLSIQVDRPLPKLCHSCSQILVDYLSPIQSYIKDIISLSDNSSNDSKLITNDLFKKKNDQQIQQQQQQTLVSSNSASTEENVNSIQTEPKQQYRSSQFIPGNNTNYNSEWKHQDSVISRNNRDQHYRQTFVSQKTNDNVNYNYNNNQEKDQKKNDYIAQSADVHNETKPNQKDEHHKQSYQGDSGTSSSTQYATSQNQSTQEYAGTPETQYSLNGAMKTDKEQHNHHQQQLPTEERHSDTKFYPHNTPVNREIQNFEETKNLSDDIQSINSRPQSAIWNNSHDLQLASDWPNQSNATSPTDQISQIPNQPQVESLVDSRMPYAYVTIAYNNLTAVNSILLANSICFYNNQIVNILENNDWQRKVIERQFYIPLVILISDELIDQELLKIIYNVFDRVIESNHQDAVLLNDDSLGIHQNKIYLWKELADSYEKCLYLESSTIVVGQLTNLFLDCDELSACVDCFFPDNFNCSVFVFEPNMSTYKDILKYGIQQKLSETEDNSHDFDTLDEITLLNQFFSSKWKKLSFIYNFIRNDLTYTQVPAYFKFGDNVRVVNFGDMTANQFYSFSANKNDKNDADSKLNSPSQPWNLKFDLNRASLEEEPFENAPYDNYIKFYLRCFVRRVWPLLSHKLTPFLLSHYQGRKEWTIFELIQVLGRLSGLVNPEFEQNPITLRRKKSWVTEQMLPLDNDIIQADLIELQEKFSETKIEDDAADNDSKEKLVNSEIDSADEPDNGNQEESIDGNDSPLTRQLEDQKNKREWEDGRIDWMGQHQSDRIINRLKNLINLPNSNK